MERGRGRQSDFDRLKIVNNLPVFALVVALVAVQLLVVGHFPVKDIASVGFIHNNQIIVGDRGHGFAAFAVQNTFDHALHSGDVDAGFPVDSLIRQPVDGVDFIQGVQFFQLHILEYVKRLRTQGITIHKEQDAAEAFAFQKAVHHAQHGPGFARPRCHSQQNRLRAVPHGPLGRLDGAELILPQIEAVFIGKKVGGHGFKALVASGNIALQKLFQTGRTHPAVQGLRCVGSIAHILKPDAGFFRELNEYSGNMVKLVTLAPNVDGAMEFIDEVHNEVCISLGHTAADYDTAAEAMRRGAHHVTHLYNAMQPLAHREPGLIGAACDDGQCMAEMICDGIHIHPAVIRATFKMFGPERIVLISDSMMATGMENGTYQLGGQDVTMKDCKATLKDGTIAGSATNLYDCMRKAVSFGVPLEEAIFAATRNPAKSIGIYDEVGSLSVGKKADILLVTDDLELREVL